jgi:hypothetical protein
MSIVAAQPETRIVIPNIRWDTFEALAASDCAGTRFSYDSGVLEIMSPSMEHEWFRRLLGQFEHLGETAWGRSFRAWVEEHYGHLARQEP